MAVNVNRMKNPRAAKQQQQGALRFYLQQELSKAKIISRLKANLKGMAVDGEPYIHDVTGNLKNSISPNKDGQKVWGKNITSKLKTDSYLGMGIGIDQVSVKIDMAEYGDILDQGAKTNVDTNDIHSWIMMKSERYPTTKWYIGNPSNAIYGSEMTEGAAWKIAVPITDKIKREGVRESGWLDMLKGKNGLNGALQRAFLRYLRDYDDYAYATVVNKLDKMLSKL